MAVLGELTETDRCIAELAEQMSHLIACEERQRVALERELATMRYRAANVEEGLRGVAMQLIHETGFRQCSARGFFSRLRWLCTGFY